MKYFGWLVLKQKDCTTYKTLTVPRQFHRQRHSIQLLALKLTLISLAVVVTLLSKSSLGLLTEKDGHHKKQSMKVIWNQ